MPCVSQGVWQTNLLMEARGFSSAPDSGSPFLYVRLPTHGTYIVPFHLIVKSYLHFIYPRDLPAHAGCAASPVTTIPPEA